MLVPFRTTVSVEVEVKHEAAVKDLQTFTAFPTNLHIPSQTFADMNALKVLWKSVEIVGGVHEGVMVCVGL